MRTTRRDFLGAVVAVGTGGAALAIDDDQARTVAADPAALVALAKPLPVGAKVGTADGFVYEVAAADSSNYHLITRGGAKLRIVSADVLNFDAFAPDKTGARDVSAALNLALSHFKAIVLQRGTYQAKNINVTAATLSFEENAVLSCVLGANDVGIKCGSGAVLENPQIRISNAAPPLHGGTGCAILIGNFTDIRERVTGVKITNPVITCLNTLPLSLGISLLGDVDDVEISNATLAGALSLGVQAHWGGEMEDPSKPATCLVKRSRHPHNIRFNGIRAIPWRNEGKTYVGYNVLSYAAAFDVHARGITNQGWQRTFLITPGDVYNFVADPDQKSKICTNMTIDGINLIDPPNLSSSATAFSQMLVNGLSQTDRTPHGRSGAVDGNFDLTIRNVAVRHSGKAPFTGAPLINLYFCAGVKVHVADITGFASSRLPLIKLSDTYRCSLVVDDAEQNLAPLISVDAAIQCDVKANVRGSAITVVNPATNVLQIGAAGGISTTIAASLSVGAKTIRLRGTGTAYTLTRYRRIHLASGFVTVSRTTIIPANGTIDVPIIASPLAAPPDARAAIKAQSIESTFTITSDRVYLPLFYQRTASCTFQNCRTTRTGKYDVQEGVVDVSNTRIVNCSFDRGGQINNGSLLANIVLGTSNGGGSDGTVVSNCVFESSRQGFVQYNIAVLSGDVSNLSISGNDFRKNRSRVLLKVAQDTASMRRGQDRFYNNKVAQGLTF